MGERARQAVFNVLGERVTQAKVLDLFAGSGALGLEAISRGATEAVFVENAAEADEVIRENIDKLNFAERALIVRTDALKVSSYAGLARHSDIVFIDPPYEMVAKLTEVSGFGKFLAELGEHDVVKPEGIVVLGLRSNSVTDERFGRLVVCDRRGYGTNGVLFLKVQEAD